MICYRAQAPTIYRSSTRLVQPPLLFSTQVNAKHVVLPVGEDAISLFGLPNAEAKYLFRSWHHHARHNHDDQAEVGLPLVPVAKEVQKLYAAELWQSYQAGVDRISDIRLRIEAEVLEAVQRERHDPTWRPRALLNGAWAFGSKIEDRMLSLWEKKRNAE